MLSTTQTTSHVAPIRTIVARSSASERDTPSTTMNTPAAIEAAAEECQLGHLALLQAPHDRAGEQAPDGDRGEQQTDVLRPVAVVGGDDRHDLLERADEHEERQRRLEDRSQQQRPPHDDGTGRQAAVLDAFAVSARLADRNREERQEHAGKAHRRDAECRGDAEPSRRAAPPIAGPHRRDRLNTIDESAIACLLSRRSGTRSIASSASTGRLRPAGTASQNISR